MHKPGLDRTRVGIFGIAGLHVFKNNTHRHTKSASIDCFNLLHNAHHILVWVFYGPRVNYRR